MSTTPSAFYPSLQNQTIQLTGINTQHKCIIYPPALHSQKCWIDTHLAVILPSVFHVSDTQAAQPIRRIGQSRWMVHAPCKSSVPRMQSPFTQRILLTSYEVEISANRCRLTRLAGFPAEVRLQGGFLYLRELEMQVCGGVDYDDR